MAVFEVVGSNYFIMNFMPCDMLMERAGSLGRDATRVDGLGDIGPLQR